MRHQTIVFNWHNLILQMTKCRTADISKEQKLFEYLFKDIVYEVYPSQTSTFLNKVIISHTIERRVLSTIQ